MTIQKTTTDLSTLKINYLTQQMYEDALENDEINENELYITPGSGGGGTVDSTAIPTANKVSEFDSNAKMNSTDMTAAQVSTFVGNLNCLNEITDDMTSAEVEGFVNDVAIPGAVVADYVIEENTSGIWTYRKWHSGKAECWGVSTESHAFSAWGNVYSADLVSVSYPTGLFIEKPLCFANITSDEGNAVASLDGGYGAGTKDQTPTAIAIRGASITGSPTFNKEYYAIGKWK